MIPDAEVTVCEEDGHILGFIGITEGDYIAGVFVRGGKPLPRGWPSVDGTCKAGTLFALSACVSKE